MVPKGHLFAHIHVPRRYCCQTSRKMRGSLEDSFGLDPDLELTTVLCLATRGLNPWVPPAVTPPSSRFSFSAGM